MVTELGSGGSVGSQFGGRFVARFWVVFSSCFPL